MIKTLIALLLFGASFCYAQDAPEEEYPSNLGPPETVYACKTVITELENKDGIKHHYGCVECPLPGDKTINTCTGIQK